MLEILLHQIYIHYFSKSSMKELWHTPRNGNGKKNGLNRIGFFCCNISKFDRLKIML